MIKRIRTLCHLMGWLQTAGFMAKWALRVPRIRVRLAGIPTPLTVRRFNSDISVLRGVFVRQDCDADLNGDVRFIIDGGANVGYSTVYYAVRYPTATIVAVEPDRENCEMIRQHCRPFPNVHVVRAALWPQPVALRIANPDAPSWAYQVEEGTGDSATTVEGVTVGELLARFNAPQIDLIKLDIEGAEEAILQEGDLEWLDKTRVLAIEPHGQQAERLVTDVLLRRSFQVRPCGEKLVFSRDSSISEPCDGPC